MQYSNMKKSTRTVCAGALILGLSLPAWAGSSGHHGDSGGHEMHGESGHHDNGSHNMMTDTVMATVISVDVANRQLVLDHGALTTIGMDAMTMGFQLDDGVSIAGIRENDKVQVTVGMKPGKGLVITEVKAVQ